MTGWAGSADRGARPATGADTPRARVAVAAPDPDLAGLVEAAVAVSRPAAGSVSRFPAMPRAMLAVAREADGALAVRFSALGTRAAVHRHAGPFEATGLVLPPVTAARLLGPTTGALVDVTLPWATIAGEAEAARLTDALGRPGADALAVLQDGLRRVLARGGSSRRSRARADALQALCGAVERQGARACGDLGLGERQLERRCRAWLGVSPKRLQRLARFHAVLAQAVRHQRLPDADTALAAGYYDQSHLAREARSLAGAPLRELVHAARADAEWWPLATQRLPRPPGRA